MLTGDAATGAETMIAVSAADRDPQGRLSSAYLAGLAASTVERLAGDGARILSLTLDIAPDAPADIGALAVRPQLSRRSAALAFITVRISCAGGGALVASASAVASLG